MCDLSPRNSGFGRGVLVCLSVVLAGCGERTSLERAGLPGFKPSPGWAVADPSRFTVPGRALAAWTGPDGASCVVYSTLAAPRVSASGLLRELTVRLENLPDLRIVSGSVRKIGGVEAAMVEVVAPGTGDSLAPSGLGRPIAPDGKTLMPTRRISLGIPGPDRCRWITWHSPEGEADSLKLEVESAIKNLDIVTVRQSSY